MQQARPVSVRQTEVDLDIASVFTGFDDIHSASPLPFRDQVHQGNHSGSSFGAEGATKSRKRSTKAKKSKPASKKKRQPLVSVDSNASSEESESEPTDQYELQEFRQSKDNLRASGSPSMTKRTQNQQMLQMERELKQLQKQNETLNIGVHALQNENAALKRETANLKKDLSKNQGQAVAMIVKEEVRDKVTSVTKHVLFRQGFMFFTEDKQLQEATGEALKLLPNYEKEFEGPLLENYILTYKAACNKGVNDKRNYAQSQMRNVALAYLDEFDRLPNTNMIMACALRKVKLDNEAHVQVFKWYWDKLLGCVVGVKRKENGWATNVKYYNTISGAKCATHPDSPLINSYVEAFLVLLYESCREKWTNMHKWRKENKGKTLADCDESFRGKYTRQDGGQQLFGGWTEEGLEQFITIRKKIRSQWKKNKPECLTLEHDFLTLLQKEKGIKCKSAEQEKRNKRNKKRKAEQMQVKVINVRGGDSSDDDEENVEPAPAPET